VRAGKKAISDLVAAMLMILIVIAATTIFYVYSMGLFGSLQGAQPQQPYTAHIALEYYDWTTLNTLRITLRNTGTEPVNFANFYVGNETWIMQIPSGSITYDSGCNSPAGALSVRTACRVTLSNIATVTMGTAYTLKAVTMKGAIFRYNCIAGSATGFGGG